MDYYTYFMHDGKRVTDITLKAGEPIKLKLEGLMYGYGGPMKRDDRISHHLISEITGAQLVTVDVVSGLMLPLEGAVTDEDEGEVEICFDEPGTYYVSSIGGSVRYSAHLVFPWLKVNVK